MIEKCLFLPPFPLSHSLKVTYALWYGLIQAVVVILITPFVLTAVRASLQCVVQSMNTVYHVASALTR